jgi:hypothetical protein
MTEHARALLLATLLSESLDATFTVRQYGHGVYVSGKECDDLLSLSATGARDWTVCIGGGLHYASLYGTPREVFTEVMGWIDGGSTPF